MFSLSSLDVHYLVKELQPLLEDSFVDKIYQSIEEKGEFLIRLRSPKAGKQQLFIAVPDACFLTTHRYTWPKDPLGFCMQLRKHLSNSKLVSVKQHSFERIIILTFAKGTITWSLILELFSKGNVVLVNSEGLIRGVFDLQRWKDRTLRVNAPYEFPPPKHNTPQLTCDQLKDLFSSQQRELVKFAATTLSLGGLYAEELIARSKLDKNATQLSDDELLTLHSSLQAFFSQSISSCTYPDNPKPLAAPFVLLTHDQPQTCESFSSAVESLVVGEKHQDIAVEQDSILSSRSDKFQRIIDEQTKKLEAYKVSSLENQRKGELIYEHYQDLQNLFSQILTQKERGGWQAVRDFISQNKLPLQIDEKTSTIILNIKDSSE